MTVLTLKFAIHILSDYHCGAGYGRGQLVDSALWRESDGRPVLRGTVLAGLLRDGASRLLSLPPLRHRRRQEVLERIFGSPRKDKRWRIDSAHPVQDMELKSRAVSRVRINPITRRAEPQKLFVQELGQAGQTFYFQASCYDRDAAALDEAALLVAAARMVRQLGRSRRRGMGECLFCLEDVQGAGLEKEPEQSWQEWFLERFERVWLFGRPDSTSPVQLEALLIDGGENPGVEHSPLRVRLIVRLDEPLIIARRSEAGNQYATHTFIPGSVLLGALAERAARRGNLDCAEYYAQFLKIFRQGAISFPFLYPAFEQNDLLYPTVVPPLGLFTCSAVPAQGYDAGHGWYLYHEVEQCPVCGEKLEQLGDYAVLRHQTITFAPRISTEMHIRVDENSQRVGQNALYGYTVLNAGQYFMGEMVCERPRVWEMLLAMTGTAEKAPFILWLGKGRRRGYGKVTVWWESLPAETPPLGIQVPLAERVQDPDGLLTLTLLSDTIVDNPWGQQAVGFTAEWLGRELGIGTVQMVKAFARERQVDSFNLTLGLPGWRATALAAGGVVWFRLLDALKEDWLDRLRSLEERGIGLRRHEGYGRIAFNHPLLNWPSSGEEGGGCMAKRNWDNRCARRNWCSHSAFRSVRLDPALRPVAYQEGREDYSWQAEVKEALHEWEEVDLSALYTALARWLYNQSWLSPQQLLANLKEWGKPDQDLITALGGPEEYGWRGRIMDNKSVNSKKEKEFRKAIQNLLDTWAKKLDETQWCAAVQGLADTLAALGKRKGSERR